MFLNSQIESLLIRAGASFVGFADITTLPKNITSSMPVGISIAVALDPAVITEIQEGPTLRYFSEYGKANKLLEYLAMQTADKLQTNGNRAVAIKPTIEELDYKTLSTTLPHKTIATLAGLGWVGKSALLITEKYGPAIRLATVLTDAELKTAQPITESRCGKCEECVKHCPSKAILGKIWHTGDKREVIYDAFTCCDMAKKLSKKIGVPATICGICICVCPWTQKYISCKPAG